MVVKHPFHTMALVDGLGGNSWSQCGATSIPSGCHTSSNVSMHASLNGSFEHRNHKLYSCGILPWSGFPLGHGGLVPFGSEAFSLSLPSPSLPFLPQPWQTNVRVIPAAMVAGGAFADSGPF